MEKVNGSAADGYVVMEKVNGSAMTTFVSVRGRCCTCHCEKDVVRVIARKMLSDYFLTWQSKERDCFTPLRGVRNDEVEIASGLRPSQ